MNPRLLTVNKAAEFVGVGRVKFLELFAPKLRPLRVGSRNLYDIADIEALIAELKASDGMTAADQDRVIQ